jgi:flagellar basal body-associated protein FliL
MEIKLFEYFGKVAGIGGIALGVLFFLFRDVLAEQFLKDVGLSSSQGFAIVFAVLILAFGIAGVGILAWIVSKSTSAEALPNTTVIVFALLIAGVIVAALLFASKAEPNPVPRPSSPKPMKSFTEDKTIENDGVAVIKGVSLKVSSIVQEDSIRYAEVSASANMDSKDMLLREGDTISLDRSDCNYLRVVLQKVYIKLSEDALCQDSTLEQLSHNPFLWPMCTIRSATVVVDGRCEE